MIGLNESSGGDSSRVRDHLKNVGQICGTNYAFAAVLVDGTVVTWGQLYEGGDTSMVQHKLRDVQHFGRWKRDDVGQ